MFISTETYLTKSGVCEYNAASGKEQTNAAQRHIPRRCKERSCQKWLEAARVMFLAMPTEVYNSLLDVVEGRDLIETEKLKIILYDAVEEVVDQWVE